MLLRKSIAIIFSVAISLLLFVFSICASEVNINDFEGLQDMSWNQPLEIILPGNAGNRYLALYTFETESADNYYKINEISIKVNSIVDKIKSENKNIINDTAIAEARKNNIEIMEPIKLLNSQKIIFKNLGFVGYIYISILKSKDNNPNEYEVFKYKAIKVKRRPIHNFFHWLAHPSRW